MPQMIPNPLLEVHHQAEAELQPYGQVEIVSTFGEPQAEYAAIRKGAALLDCPHRAILELRGKDRLPFLNNLLTNETWNKQTKAGLASGQGVYAFLLNIKGRIVSDVNVLELGDRTYLEMESRMIEPVLAMLDKYLFAEQVKLASQLEHLHEIAVHGPGALNVLNKIASTPVLADLPPLGSVQTTLYDVPVMIWRDDPAGVPGFNLILPIDQARSVWMKLIAGFSSPDQAGKRLLRPAGWAAFNATRIEAGRPLFGIDFDDSVLPAETGQLARAVSFTKGCYLGQEIVARMHARGQVARQLVGLKMESDALPIAGAKVFDEQQNEIGGITSSTLSPVLSNRPIALGFLKKPFFTPGTRILVPAEGAIHPATVTEVPFIRP